MRDTSRVLAPRLTRPLAAASAWPSGLVAFGFCQVVTCALVVASPAFRHWFVVPVTMCGVVIGIDAVEWCRGRLDLFDPVGVLGAFGFHFFYAAPLLHVYWDYWLPVMAAPADWRDWLGWMAVVNFVGLLSYRFARSLAQRAGPFMRERVWHLTHRRWLPAVTATLFVAGVAQFLVYAAYGGISGYVRAYMVNPESFQGTGWIFMVSECFPIVAMMAFAVYVRRRGVVLSVPVILLTLLVFVAIQLLFGGLRGSRSNTVWALFWAVGVVHLWLRPLSRGLIVVGLVFLTAFVYVYGFYKETGFQTDLAESVRLGARRGRNLEAVILGDFARSDVQAFVLFRLAGGPVRDYEYAWGATYAGAAALLIPRTIWPERPPTSVRAGTDAQRYVGAYAQGRVESSRVYGLAGEAMLNFGPYFVPATFAVLGWFVGRLRRVIRRLPPFDSRRLMAPFLVNLCFGILAGDSDGIVFFLIKQGFVPFCVVAATSLRQPVRVS